MARAEAGQVVPRQASGAASSARAPPTAAGMRKRTQRASGSTGARMANTVANFYTDETPGIKMSPIVIVVMSLTFIGFVTLLHIIGKIRGG